MARSFLFNTEFILALSSVANVRGNETTYHTVSVDTVDDEGDPHSWDSPKLIVEDYEYDTDEVRISGRCRLAELDREDQVIEVADEISTVDDMSLSAVLTLIAGHCGLTVTGSPARTVREYQLVGNPLEMFRDLLEPTHVFRMGSGSAILIESASDHGAASISLADSDDLEILKFRRSTEIYNKATVERIEREPGMQVLYHQQVSGELGEITGTLNGDQAMTPSRSFIFRIKEGYRGEINSIVLKDEGGDPVSALPLNQPAYVGVTPIHSFTFNYEVDVDWEDLGPATLNWEIKIEGFSLSDSPPAEEGYSATATAGTGHRPYPEPFSSVTINTQGDAETAAAALVEQGTRIGNILNCSTRLRANFIADANGMIAVEDAQSGISESVVVEAVSVAWDESGDTGTITYECTIPEAS